MSDLSDTFVNARRRSETFDLSGVRPFGPFGRSPVGYPIPVTEVELFMINS